MAHLLQKISLQLAATAGPTGALLGTSGWAKVFEELGDDQLQKWFAEVTQLAAEAQRAEAKAAAAAAGKAARPGGRTD
jgi:hypothetical protein